jgi:hypothetical protein
MASISSQLGIRSSRQNAKTAGYKADECYLRRGTPPPSTKSTCCYVCEQTVGGESLNFNGLSMAWLDKTTRTFLFEKRGW